MTPADVYKMRLSVTQYWSALAIHDSSQIFSARFDNSFFPMRNLELRQSNILQSASHQAPALFESRLETVFFFK